MRVIVALAIGIVTQVAASDICDNGWIMYAGRCYKHFMGEPLMQAEAEDKCVKMRGHLVSINNEGENNFIKTFAKIGGTQADVNQPWIGLVKKGDEFVWTDGTTGNGWVWGEKEPYGQGDCVLLVADKHPNPFLKEGVLNDARCNYNTTRFICERAPGVGCPVEGVVTEPPVGDEEPATAECKNGWISYWGHCYKHFNCSQSTGELFTQQEAEAECVKMSGHLASINTPGENEFLRTISKMGGVHELSSEPWVGLMIGRDLFNQQTFGWTDGTTGTGLKWAPKKPSGQELCGLFLPDAYSSPFVEYEGETGLITNARCSHLTSRFICEREPEVESNGRECDCPSAPTTATSPTTSPAAGNAPYKT